MVTPAYCYRHPNRETTLRCNSCDNYICPSCAVHTPTGYKCKDCIKTRNREFIRAYTTANWYDYILAPIVAGILGFIGTLISAQIGFFIFFLIILGPIAGVYIAKAVQWSVQRRRSKYLPHVATAGVVVGGLLTQTFTLMNFFLTWEVMWLGPLLWPVIFIGIAATTTYMRLAGIQISR